MTTPTSKDSNTFVRDRDEQKSHVVEEQQRAIADKALHEENKRTSSVSPDSHTLENSANNEGKADDSHSRDERIRYKDYSYLRAIPAATGNLSPTSASIRVQKLPAKLNAMLANPAFQNIISWMPHGRSWKVHNPHAFVEDVIPKYFEYTNYNSFVRLVNAWGFRRITKGPDRNSYYHELFLRGMPHLHAKMHRLTASEKKPPLDPDDEPDLYIISELCPLPQASPDSDGGLGPSLSLPPALLPGSPLFHNGNLISSSAPHSNLQMNLGGSPTLFGALGYPIDFPSRLGGTMNSFQDSSRFDEEEMDAVNGLGSGSARSFLSSHSGVGMSGLQRQRVDMIAARQQMEMRLDQLRNHERRQYLSAGPSGPTPSSLVGGLPISMQSLECMNMFGTNSLDAMGIGRRIAQPVQNFQLQGGMQFLSQEMFPELATSAGLPSMSGGNMTATLLARWQQQQQQQSQNMIRGINQSSLRKPY